MPLAIPLVVVLAVLLAGCAQSSRGFGMSMSQGWLNFLAGGSDPASAGHPERAPQTEKASEQVLPETAAACERRQIRGIAEVVKMLQDQVLLRFYPGDQVFLRDRHERALLGARVGDELRSLRDEPVAGDCEAVSYELLSEGWLPTDQELAWVPGA